MERKKEKGKRRFFIFIFIVKKEPQMSVNAKRAI